MAVYKRGETWWYNFQFRGIPIRESAHTTNRTKALNLERARKNELDRGASPLEKKPAEMTFKTAAEQYLKRGRSAKGKQWRPSTLSAETYNVRHLQSAFGGRLITDIRPNDITPYQSSRRSEGAAPKTIDLEYSTLRSILSHHDQWAKVQRKVSQLGEESNAGRALSTDEIRRLLEGAASSRSRSIYPALLVSLDTGLRNQELRLLKWHQVDLIDCLVTVGVSKTKSGRGRHVPLSATATAALRDWRSQFPHGSPGHFVFPSERVDLRGEQGYLHGASIAYDTDPTNPMGSWKVAWNAVRRLARVDCRWHDMRHTACTRLLESGVPFAVVGAIMGWSASTTIAMAKRYGHIRNEVTRAAMATFDRDEIFPLPDGHKAGHSAVMHY
jgi:integrase